MTEVRTGRPDDLRALLALEASQTLEVQGGPNAPDQPLGHGSAAEGAVAQLSAAEPDPRRVAALRAAVMARQGCLVVDGPQGPAGFVVRRPAQLLGHDLVENLVVAPQLRRRGIGLALLRAAAEVAGPAAVWTYAPSTNLAMRALLAADGWSVCGRLDGDRIDLLAGEPAVLFSRPGDQPGRPGTLYHVALRRDWERAVRDGIHQVSTTGVSVAEAGFVHLAFGHQVPGVLERFYADEARPLVLLEIARARLTPPLRLEPGGDEMFPHLYGPFDPAAVIDIHPLEGVRRWAEVPY